MVSIIKSSAFSQGATMPNLIVSHAFLQSRWIMQWFLENTIPTSVCVCVCVYGLKHTLHVSVNVEHEMCKCRNHVNLSFIM
jgi:hypothetical protein